MICEGVDLTVICEGVDLAMICEGKILETYLCVCQVFTNHVLVVHFKYIVQWFLRKTRCILFLQSRARTYKMHLISGRYDSG